MARTFSSARIEARVPATVHVLLERAAQIQGRTLTDFVVSAAQDAARRAIEAAEIVRVSADDQRRLASALLEPREPSAALRRAFRRRRSLLGA